jgi:hypothetical protein
MTTFYVPFKGNTPAALSINGHRLVILSKDKEAISTSLDLMGANRVRRVRSGPSEVDQAEALQRIGKAANSGVVIAPPDAPVEDVLRSLEVDLPWLQ